MSSQEDTTCSPASSLGGADASPAANADGELMSCLEVVHQVIRRFHSDVGSPLAAMGLQLEMMQHSDKCDPQTKETLEEIGKGLDAVIRAVRESLRDLRELEASASRANR